jgi:hypothetical protein
MNLRINQQKPLHRRVRLSSPFVYVFGARYTSNYLRSHPELAGTELMLTIDPKDFRRIVCHDPNGRRLPDLEVTGALKHTAPQTLEDRKTLLRAARRLGISHKLSSEEDPLVSLVAKLDPH